MATPQGTDAIFHPLSKLKEAVTEQSVRSLRTERFPEAQAFLQIGQELKELETRLRSLVNGAPPTQATPAEPPPRSPKTYPRFARNGEILVKIGQRRDRKGTYEQKVGREEFDAIVRVLREVGGEKASFEAGEVIQRVQVPSYQVYLVIGFLQEHGVLDSPTRGQYRLSPDNLRRLPQAWELASARG